jgi:hypothetical protein
MIVHLPIVSLGHNSSLFSQAFYRHNNTIVTRPTTNQTTNFRATPNPRMTMQSVLETDCIGHAVNPIIWLEQLSGLHYICTGLPRLCVMVS